MRLRYEAEFEQQQRLEQRPRLRLMLDQMCSGCGCPLRWHLSVAEYKAVTAGKLRVEVALSRPCFNEGCGCESFGPGKGEST